MATIPFNVERHKKTLADERDKISRHMVDGKCADFAEYKGCAGQVKALTLSINLLAEALKKDDEDGSD